MQQMNKILEKTLAYNTTRNYNRSQKNYFEYCKMNNLQLYPLHETNIMLFITQLQPKSKSNIQTHISAIKHHATQAGYYHDFDFPRLYMLSRAIKRMENNKNKKPQRIPITPPEIVQIYTYLSHSKYNKRDRSMLWTATNTAFFGFLRSSEYTSQYTTKFNPDTTLCYHDIKSKHNLIEINIKSSKTDPFKQGCTVKISRTYKNICPMSAMEHFLTIHPTKKGPLFMYSNGTNLTRQRFNDFLKTVFPRSTYGNISTHSFRIGAATTAAAAGLPKWLIQKLGRWNSDSFRTYIRIPIKTIQETTRVLASTNKHVSVWDPDLF